MKQCPCQNVRRGWSAPLSCLKDALFRIQTATFSSKVERLYLAALGLPLGMLAWDAIFSGCPKPVPSHDIYPSRIAQGK